MTASLLDRWHDFSVRLGTAAATPVGLMFVAASIGIGMFTTDCQDGMRTLLSPTVVAWPVVLAISLIAVLPTPGTHLPGTHLPGLSLAGIGVLGAVYLLRAGNRNAWDMTTRAVLRRTE